MPLVAIVMSNMAKPMKTGALKSFWSFWTVCDGVKGGLVEKPWFVSLPWVSKLYTPRLCIGDDREGVNRL